MTQGEKLGLFDGYGIEMEYMIVDAQTLNPDPISDQVLTALAGELTDEVAIGEIAWSNELVMHVIELKANGPTKNLKKLKTLFLEQVRAVNDLLVDRFDAFLLPTAMHPTMDPSTQMRLWPHGNKEIYETYNKIFNCQGHGWSNLQSVHINLPFANDDEFGRLHAAIRLALPILPALAASSPFVEGKATGFMDNRLRYYRQNQAKIPTITGAVIPEACFTEKDYDQKIFQTMYKSIATLDPQKILQYEWLNSRGAIARFDRSAIEIRVLDIQECQRADFAVIGAVVSLVESLVDETWISYEEQKRWKTEDLSAILFNFLDSKTEQKIENINYLKVFGLDRPVHYRELWQHISQELSKHHYPLIEFYDDLSIILEKGSLAQRLVKGAQEQSLQSLYKHLNQCLMKDEIFVA